MADDWKRDAQTIAEAPHGRAFLRIYATLAREAPALLDASITAADTLLRKCVDGGLIHRRALAEIDPAPKPKSGVN